MPRPVRNRKMGKPPGVKGFRPHGTSQAGSAVELFYEEYEALKLADYNGFSQVEAAKKMGVSRPTFTRIYDRALKKIARAFVEHHEIVIKGGQVTFDDDWFRCDACHYVFKMPGKDNEVEFCPICGSSAITDETAFQEETETEELQDWCICVECNHKVKHQAGVPCRDMECPECSGRMKRQKV